MAHQYPETTLSTEEEVKRDDTEDVKKEIITEALPFHKLLSYADALDWILMALGALGSIVHGLAQPIGYLLLGKALDAFGNNIHDTKAMVKALKKVIPFVWYMAFATFPAGVLEIGCWMYTSERQVARLRLAFMRAVLSQEIGAFDTDLTTGKIITGMSGHMSIIQDAIGEKTISQIKTVFAFVGESSAIKYFSEYMKRQFILSKGEALIKGVGLGMFQTVTFCSWALIVWVGAIVVTAGRAKGGDVIAAVMSILFGAISITYAAPDMQIFNQAKVAGKEVFQVITRKPLISYNSKGKRLKDFHCLFQQERSWLLWVVAGVGRALSSPWWQDFMIPQKVRILIDNHNIKELDLKFLRKNIGAVSQEPSLFAGTIKDNMKVGNIDADDKQIQRAAEMANASTFISQLPNQYLTEVGQRGVQLSGGQKQRIAIARAILKNPPILLLDEATSALDSESEKLVQDALEMAMQGRTVILIAHRMSTIINADMIVVVENGKVKETGTHHNLLDKSIFYNKLFSTQNINLEGDSRLTDPAKQPTYMQQQISSQYVKQPDEPTELNSHQNDSPKEEEQKGRRNTAIFFRIWLSLKKSEHVKTAIGSFAAAFSGISKPIFGFFIITIGVAYYESDSKRIVGLYSVFFSSIGLLSLFSHIVQHYVFGIIGEKAMINLRQALYTAVLRNELAWFEKPENSSGLLTSRIINDTAMVKTIIADRMSVIVQCISSIVIATTVSMVVNWRMALVAWAVMPCHFIGGLIQAKSAKGFSGDIAAAHSELVALTSESATNIKTVASFCYEEHILEKVRMSLDGPIKRSRKRECQVWDLSRCIPLLMEHCTCCCFDVHDSSDQQKSS
ncbi:ATP binding cassette subfamily B1 [Actinidia rufa]|uniref:ATP binding cassette subfamily B1 n=1 Tax=Actinidia rufa TaxID=165716 RepID=A0A7J0GYT6_9ERIC|nr:ATP binding cassette subfamily B1 [Actinidia rufa]